MLTSLMLTLAFAGATPPAEADLTKGPRFVPVARTDPDVADDLAKVAPQAFRLAQADKTKERELRIRARGNWLGAAKLDAAAVQRVIHSPAEAAQAMGLPGGPRGETLAAQRVSQVLGGTPVDWARQMVIVVTAGAKRTGGYGVQVVKVETGGDKSMTVHYRLTSPRPGSAVPQMVSHPGTAVLVDRVDGEPRFVEETKK